MFTLTTKLAHRLYYDAIAVDYDLFIKCFNIGNAEYPVYTRLHKD